MVQTMVQLGSCHRRQYITNQNSFITLDIKKVQNMDLNKKPIKQTFFDETKVTVYEVRRHRGRGRSKTRNKAHPRRSLSQGATPRSRNTMFAKQPLAPQRRLSVSKLKLKGNYSSHQKWTLFCLSIVSFTSMLSMSIIAPFFPLEASMKGMRETIYGFVFSVYAFVIMILSPVSGMIIPLIGPKFMLISGVFITGVSNILFGFLDQIEDLSTFTVYCFIVRIFEAIGAAAFSTASYTIIMQAFPDNIGTAFGFIETCVGLGMSLGPAIGGGLYGLGGYGLPFYILGGIMLINIPICWVIIKPFQSLNPEPRKDTSDSYWKLISIPQVLVVGIVVVIVSQNISFLDPTIEPHFREMNISPEYVSIVFLLLSAAYTIFSPIVGWVSGLIDNKFPVMALGLFLSCDGLLFLGPSFLIPLNTSLLMSIASMALIGVAYAIAFIPTFETILDIAIDKGFSDSISTYSLVSGLWSSMYSLGEVTGPSLGGWLSENFDFSIASTIMAAFSLFGAIIAGITCFFARFEDSDSSSSESESDCEKSTSSKSGKSSRASSQSDQYIEYKPLLENSLNNNNNYYGIKEKEIIFTAASI